MLRQKSAASDSDFGRNFVYSGRNLSDFGRNFKTLHCEQRSKVIISTLLRHMREKFQTEQLQLLDEHVAFKTLIPSGETNPFGWYEKTTHSLASLDFSY